MLRPSLCILLLSFILSSYGCASITRGTTETFIVESDPLGADVRLSSGETCKTPCTLTKKHNDKFMVFITKKDYEPVEVAVSHKTCDAGAAGMAGNVLLGGLIGVAVDAGTGATQELCPNPVKVALVPLQQAHETPMVDSTTLNNTPAADTEIGIEESDPLVSKLRKYKQMADEGLISEEEYEIIKQHTLDVQHNEAQAETPDLQPTDKQVQPASVDMGERF
jgi:hypothetical protein